MKRTNIVILLLPVVFLLASCKGGTANVDKSFPSGKFKIMKGTNLGHWLSQSRARGEERAKFITEKDIRFIDSLGFDHIRLPIDEEQMWDENEKRNEEAFTLMVNCIEWARKAGLRVILDLHILRSHYFNAAEKPLWTKPEEQDKFIRLWKDLSACLHEYPNSMLAYELMNEPVADDPEQWNSLIARTVDSVRAWEPLRVIVLGSNKWQSAATFDQLKIPANDTNIVLSFHFYEPMPLTHYKAGWTEFKDFNGEVQYPGQIVANATEPRFMKVYNRDTLLKMMQKPIHFADSTKIPLYCGEFGVYMEYWPEAKLAWYTDMVSIFREYGIAYANWNYKSTSFGIVDNQGNLIMEKIARLLAGKE